MNIELYIRHGDIYAPLIIDTIELSQKRVGEPATLNFTVLKDNIINFQEGDAVRLTIDNKNIFYGFVFTKSRDKEHKIAVTCYDQLRYLKNKFTYVYSNKTASELIKMIADDFNLKIGTIEDTKIKLNRIEDNKTLFDIILSAIDETLLKSKQLYILYDDFGKITLKNIESMQLKSTVIDDSMLENFNYTSSIDKDTYNKIVLYHDNDITKKREIYQAQDSENINRWGVLQMYESFSDSKYLQEIADGLIDRVKGKNKKTRELDLINVKGNINVRAGCSLPISLNIGDISVKNMLVVDSVTHKFSGDNYFMDLHLIGGNGFV